MIIEQGEKMYITNVTGVDSCRIMKNESHSENVPEELRGVVDVNVTDIGKEFVKARFDTERGGNLAVELVPLEEKGILSIYIDYLPGEDGLYVRQIDIDIETGDIVDNKFRASEDFHSKFPFTDAPSE